MDQVSTVHAVVIEDLDTGQRWSCSDHQGYDSIVTGLNILGQATELWGHNILCYDLPVLRRLFPGFKPNAKVRDTLVMTRLIWADIEANDFELIKRDPQFPAKLIGAHSLKAWGYRLKCLKGTYCEETDWKEWSPEMQKYCEQDVTVSVLLAKLIESKRYSEEAVQLEHDFRWVIHLQERNGFPFNRDAAVRLYQTLVKRRNELTVELQQAFPPTYVEMKKPTYWYIWGGNENLRWPTKGEAVAWCRKTKVEQSYIRRGPNARKAIPFNPGSRVQIAKRLIEKGWVPKKFTEKGAPQVDESVLEELPYPEAKLLAKYLFVQKRIGQLAEGDKSWLFWEKNGRIHGAVITNGTVTGRCAHFNPNLGQVPAVRVGKDKKPLLGEDGLWGYECRALFGCDEDYALVGADASSLELRCLGHYMARYDGGAYAHEVIHGDVHSLNAAALGLPRADAKTWVYAYLYGAGDELLGINAGGAKPEEIELYKRTEKRRWSNAVKRLTKKGRKVDDQTIGNMIKGGLLRKQFEQKTPALAKLKEEIEKVVATRGYLIGLDGRRLHIRSAHSALNTLLQSAGSILVKKATTLFYRHMTERGYQFGRGSDYSIVVHVHDEWQTQTRPCLTEEVGKLAVQSIKEAGEHFKFRCPLSGEYKIGKTWAETH